MVIPFLFDIRTILDWALTETTLQFNEWIKVEAIFTQVFQIKCNREINKNEPTRGRVQDFVMKMLFGGGITLFLLGVLWFPLFLFAFSSALENSNIPYEISVSVQIGTYEPIFEAIATKSNIQVFEKSDFNKLIGIYTKYPEAMTFLEEYEASDVVAVSLSTNSTSLWNISPPNAAKMIEDIKKSVAKKISLNYRITRQNSPETIFDVIETKISGQAMREKLVDMLKKRDEEKYLMIPAIFPKLLNIRKKGIIETMPEFAPGARGTSS